MPHFYFHLHNGGARREDRRGVSLPDAEAAWYQAYRSAREILGAAMPGGGELAAHVLQIEDEGGAPVWTVPLADIAEIAR
jgi:hypothetical protein